MTPPENVIAAIQAAGRAQEYGVAINLICEHKLADRCLGCATTDWTDSYTWQLGDLAMMALVAVNQPPVPGDVPVDVTQKPLVLRTCHACTEDFARWYVGRSASRQLFEYALHKAAAMRD